jgi:hypothetical protein
MFLFEADEVNYILHCPAQVMKYLNIRVYDTDSTKEVLSKVDWLTSGLRNEIMSYFPQKVDIDKKRSNARDPAAFAEKAKKLFPIGRIFIVISNWIKLQKYSVMHGL